MKSPTNLSRREFMGVAGGIAGAAALASVPFEQATAENKPKIDAKTFQKEKRELDVLVIGGGMAGLFAAVKAHDAGAKVLLVSKGRVGSSGQTPFAKGIFSYDKNSASMSIDEFVAKVSESAIQTNNPVFTRQLAEHSSARVEELKSWGFFDSPLYHHSFMYPIKERGIEVNERVMITHLLKESGNIVGASGFSLDENKLIHYQAKSVVLCTGAGGFKPNGFPICDLTHDGTIMAYKAGAKVTGKEWNDGHPGSAENSASCFDNWHGQVGEKPSITSVTINHHLGVDMNYQAYKQGSPVKFGPPGRGQKQQPTEGPYVPKAFRMSGRPPRPPEDEGLLSNLFAGDKKDRRGPPKQSFWSTLFSGKKRQGPPGMGGEQVGGSSAGLAIHKSEGLVPINEFGLSTLPGLYAAGDALGSYMSGGIYTQIGGSLAGSAVQGALAGEAAAKESLKAQQVEVSESYLKQVEAEILAPLKRKRGYDPAWVTQVLQSVMIPNFVLYIKKERLMQAALAYVEELKEHHVPMLIAKDRHSLRLAHETENMIITAEMKMRASIMRKESRCSHYRLDYPEIDNKNWQAWINIDLDEQGNMRLQKQPFDKWPAFS